MINQTSQPSGWSALRRHTGAVRRRWRLVLVVALAAMTGALVYSLAQPPTYRASTDILLSPTIFDVGQRGSTIEPEEVNTQAQVVTSQPVAELVQQDLGLREAPDLSRRVVVEAMGASRVLRITTMEPSATDAADLARSVATSYLSFRRTNAQQSLTEVQAALADRQQTVENRLNRINRQLNRSPDNSARLQAERRNLLAELGQLTARQTSLDTTVSRSAGGSVLTEPSTPSSPASPRPVLNLVLALLAGLLAGVTLALLRDRFGPRVNDAESLRETLGGVPVLGSLPAWRSRRSRSLVTVTKPDSRLSQAFHALAARVRSRFARHRGTEGDGAVVLCTSAEEGEGKSVVAANLAVAAAHGGLRVVLVDADLRRRSSNWFMEVPPESAGVSELSVNSEAPVESYLLSGPVDGVRFLPAGPVRGDVTGLVASGRLQSMLEKLAGHADLVVIDAPPTLHYADAMELADVADLVLLVTRLGKSRRVPVSVAAERMRAAAPGAIGAVAIGSDMSVEADLVDLKTR